MQAPLSVKVPLAGGIIRRMASKTPPDKERGERIKHIRKKLFGFKAQEDLSDAISLHTGIPLSRGAVGNWERGMDIGLANMTVLAEMSGVAMDWIAYGQGNKPTALGRSQGTVLENVDQGATVPLIGYVRAGSSAAYYATATDPLDWVAPIDDMTKETVAVQIQGDSLGELFDTWLIYYDEVRSPVTADLIGKLCVVGLLDDRVVVKKLRKAKVEGRYNLLSNTGQEDILDVEVAWAARVKNMAPR